MFPNCAYNIHRYLHVHYRCMYVHYRYLHVHYRYLHVHYRYMHVHYRYPHVHYRYLHVHYRYMHVHYSYLHVYQGICIYTENIIMQVEYKMASNLTNTNYGTAAYKHLQRIAIMYLRRSEKNKRKNNVL